MQFIEIIVVLLGHIFLSNVAVNRSFVTWGFIGLPVT